MIKTACSLIFLILMFSSVICFAQDTTPPSVSIIYNDGDALFDIGQTVRITAQLDEAMADLPVPRLKITGADYLSPTNMTKVSSTEYYIDYTVNLGYGNCDVSLVEGEDIAGNTVNTTPTSGGVFTIDGSPQAELEVGKDILVNTYTVASQDFPKLSGIEGGYVVTWKSNGQDGSGYGVFAQRYDNSGTLQGSEFQVNTYTTGNQQNPRVSAIEGGFVIAWPSDGQDGSANGVYAQRYDNSGTPQGSEFQVNTYTTSNQQSPYASAIYGGFVIAWSSNGQDGSGYGVYAQRYDNSGTPQGSEFQVNTYTTGNQQSPNVSAIDAGFVITWMSNGQDGSVFGVYAQRYDISGTPQGGEFQVNTYTSNMQRSSAVQDIENGFVITWASEGQDGAYFGIFSKKYTNSGALCVIEPIAFIDQPKTFNQDVHIQDTIDIGNLKAGLITIDQAFADYVFEENYPLRPIDDVESYIQQHLRLPGIPSGEDIEKTGLPVGEMCVKQMEKIEELMLYAIELRKKHSELEDAVEALEKEVKNRRREQ